MNIDQHIQLQQSYITSLNTSVATATSLGNVAELVRLRDELNEAESTLQSLLTLKGN
jgi:hypothetical protein